MAAMDQSRTRFGQNCSQIGRTGRRHSASGVVSGNGIPVWTEHLEFEIQVHVYDIFVIPLGLDLDQSCPTPVLSGVTIAPVEFCPGPTKQTISLVHSIQL